MNKVINTTHYNLQEHPLKQDTSSLVLFSKGQAEIFTDVMSVQYYNEGRIVIDHGQPGCHTVSNRSLDGVYKIYSKGPLFESETIVNG